MVASTRGLVSFCRQAPKKKNFEGKKRKAKNGIELVGTGMMESLTLVSDTEKRAFRDKNEATACSLGF